MNSTQIVQTCQERGIQFRLLPSGRFTCRGPESLLTPHFVETMKRQHDALLPAVIAIIANQEEKQTAPVVEAVDTPKNDTDALPADILALGAECEAAIQAEEDRRLQNAVNAARAGAMPCADSSAAAYDGTFTPLTIRKGVSVDAPGLWLVRAIDRAQSLRARYGSRWWHEERNRPLADSYGPALWEEIETVVAWWYEWQTMKRAQLEQLREETQTAAADGAERAVTS